MTRCCGSAAAVAAVVVACLPAAGGQARAQTTIDVAKITCEQWQAYKVANPDQIALWVSGYLAGKSGTTVLDVQTFRDTNVKKVRDRCFREPKRLLMDVVAEAFAGAK